MVSQLSFSVLFALLLLQGEPLIETRLTWEGKVSAPTLTELAIEGTSSSDTSLAIESWSRPLTVRTELELRQGTRARTSIPAGFGDSSETIIRYSVAGSPWKEIDAGYTQHGARSVVAAGDMAVQRLGQVRDTIVVPVTDLPRLALAYTHVAAVVLGSDALARLDEQQLRALLEHVGVCGRLLLIDSPPQVEQLIAQRAGCGGRNLIATAANNQLASALDALLAKPGGRLPAERSLSRLVDDRSGGLRLVFLYLGGFFLMFVALTALSRSQRNGIVFSLVATILAGLLWTTGSQRHFVAWAEASTTDGVARYAGLERASATGRGAQVLQMKSLARSPVRITGDGLVLHWSDTAQERYLDWSAALLQEMQILSAGSFPLNLSLRAQLDGEAVIVCNLGDGETAAGYLRWRGTDYEMPPLQPGARWTADAESVRAAPAVQLDLLAQRSPDRGVSLLHPLEVPANGGNQIAWLMRTESGSQEEPPCRS